MQLFLQIIVFTVCFQKLRCFTVTNVTAKSWKELLVLLVSIMVKKKKKKQMKRKLAPARKRNKNTIYFEDIQIVGIHSITIKKNMCSVFFFFPIYPSNVLKD